MKRGMFIVLEGPDRTGKSTMTHLLCDYMTNMGLKVEIYKYPDRDTEIGQLINNALTNSIILSPKALHLLFVADRWERDEYIRTRLQQGIHVIADRYCYSGIAYGVGAENLDESWCINLENGLIAPDIVFYMYKRRASYGDEIYENEEIQLHVGNVFDRLARLYGFVHVHTDDDVYNMVDSMLSEYDNNIGILNLHI